MNNLIVTIGNMHFHVATDEPGVFVQNFSFLAKQMTPIHPRYSEYDEVRMSEEVIEPRFTLTTKQLKGGDNSEAD